jgi:nitrogenase-stabilizing/protective protein
MQRLNTVDEATMGEMIDVSTGNILDKLKASSSAEDIFELLGVGYDSKVMNVARLHILKQMGDYLACEDLADIPDSIVTARCKAVLERAYEDFVSASPLQRRVFKVLKNAVAPPKPANFVPFDALLK